MTHPKLLVIQLNDVRGLSLQFGSKTFTGFEIGDLEIQRHYFLLLLCSKKEENCRGSTFKFCNFKASEVFATKSKWQALHIYEMELQYMIL